MRVINTVILFFSIIICNAQTNNLDNVRRSYLQSDKSEENIRNLISSCEEHNFGNDSIIYAYKTVAELMLIKYKYNPFHKINLFTNYSRKLDLIVSNNINNIEIRVLRYCMQKQSPRFLDYDNNLELDYQFILKNIDFQSKELKVYIHSILKLL